MRRAVSLLFTLLLVLPQAHMSSLGAETNPKPLHIALAESQSGGVSESEIHNFSAAYNSVKRYYVEPVNDGEIFENAIRGMLTGLDPHSDYLNPSEFKALRDNTSGKFAGLGVEIGVEHGLLKVISPLDDTPAFHAGVKAGDYIIKLDKKPVKGMTLREAMNLMRGKQGSPIVITVLRRGEDKPLKINIIRDYIHLKSVKSHLLDKHFGYVRISQFQLPTADDLAAHVDKLEKQSGGRLTGLILDLRNNPGGLLDSAVDVSDAFLDSKKMAKNKKIVFTKGRMPQTMIQANATPGDILEGTPIVVLINEGSASSSEIVAGALQDHNRAIVLGTQSFGKGSVQTVLPIGHDRGVKLTTAFYYTPHGRLIQARGIKPDVKVEEQDVVEKAETDPDFEIIREADLMGHLDGDTPANSKPKLSKQASQMQEKLLADYQVQQALNLLKGLAIKQYR